METHLQPGRGQGPAWAESFLSPLPSWRQDALLGLSWQQGAPCCCASQWSWEGQLLESTEPPCCAPRSGFLQEPMGHDLPCLCPGLGHGWPLCWNIGSTWPSLLDPLVSLVLWQALNGRMTDDSLDAVPGIQPCRALTGHSWHFAS